MLERKTIKNEPINDPYDPYNLITYLANTKSQITKISEKVLKKCKNASTGPNRNRQIYNLNPSSHQCKNGNVCKNTSRGLDLCSSKIKLKPAFLKKCVHNFYFLSVVLIR